MARGAGEVAKAEGRKKEDSPLLEEALSKGGTCLIVGDGKQSIYRWRGGDVSQFLSVLYL